MLFWKYKKIMICVTSVTFYKNYHLLMSIFPHIFLCIKYLVKDKVFEYHFGTNVGSHTLFYNVCAESSTSLLSGLGLKNYLNYANEN